MAVVHTFLFVGVLLLIVSVDALSTSGVTGDTSFATKTIYNQRLTRTISFPLFWDQVIDGYDVIYIDGTFRHGTRFPSDEKVEKWRKHLVHISKYDINNTISDTLKLWSKHFPNNRSYMLHDVGKMELQQLASTIFSMTKHGKHIDFSGKGSLRFMSSPKVRAKQSACSFVNKLLCLGGNKASCLNLGKIEDAESDKEFECTGILVPVNPMLLRSFDYCPKYSEKVTKNKTADHQVKKFGNSVHAAQVVDDISNKFTLHQVCAFHFALHNHTAICDLFDSNHMKVMEYANDLKHYYKTGYGYEINYKLSCPLIKDIIIRLDDAANSNGANGGTFRFGHAETVIPLLCILGFYQDNEHLTSDSFHTHQEKRLFRTGMFSPFAGNILFVLYRPTNAAPEGQVKFSIVVNEQVVKIPNTNCHVCDYNVIRQQLFDELNKLDCASVCALDQKDEL